MLAKQCALFPGCFNSGRWQFFIVPKYKSMFLCVLKGATNRSLPYIVFGTINLIVGVLTLMLPETKGLAMPATIQEAKDLEAYANSLTQYIPNLVCKQLFFFTGKPLTSLDRVVKGSNQARWRSILVPIRFKQYSQVAIAKFNVN